ncbi:MAG TPA: cytochrome P450 [Ktedonobacteraceae bacterium]|nr:cytochrome P450 [Ktedonobacteraceae bacterium]
MQPVISEQTKTTAAGAGCPVDHIALSRQKTAREVEPTGIPIECDEAGTWHVRGFAEARAILRNSDTKQAGFKAELIGNAPHMRNQPILYQEGKVHHAQRKQTARFFTPKTVSTHYRGMMEQLVDRLIAEVQRKKSLDLSRLTMTLSARVTGEVVGLTSSRLPGTARRIDAFFTEGSIRKDQHLRRLLHSINARSRVLSFFFLDVKPAIQTRKRQPKEDVISHLIAQNYNDAEILTECITYGAAGMVTTREFISAAAWHFLDRPELRARYLAAPEAERYAMLEEVLRLEPIVGNIYRHATADITVESNGQQFMIPCGALIDVRVHGTNTDESVVGEHPLEVCPGRTLQVERVAPSVMSFGDGHHRCPGSYIAIQETDMFLQRLLALDTLHIVRQPSLAWNDVVTGYEIRDFIVSL